VEEPASASTDIVSEVMLLLVMALDSFFSIQLSSPVASSVVFRNADHLHDPFLLGPRQIDRQQPVLEVSA